MRRAPHHYGCHVAALKYLSAQWYGSHRECFDFAEQAAEDAPARLPGPGAAGAGGLRSAARGPGARGGGTRRDGIVDAAADRALSCPRSTRRTTCGRRRCAICLSTCRWRGAVTRTRWPSSAGSAPGRPPSLGPARRGLPLRGFPEARADTARAVARRTPLRAAVFWSRASRTRGDGPVVAAPAPLRLTAVTTARLQGLCFRSTRCCSWASCCPERLEQRYRAMMRDLLKTDESEPWRFAVVAIRDREVAPTAPGLPGL